MKFLPADKTKKLIKIFKLNEDKRIEKILIGQDILDQKGRFKKESKNPSAKTILEYASKLYRIDELKKRIGSLVKNIEKESGKKVVFEEKGVLKEGSVIGTKVKITDGNGVDSNKTGVIINPREVKTDGRGIPTNVQGAYKPVDWKKEFAIKLDNGEIITMFKNRVKRITESKKKLTKQEAIKKLTQIIEARTKRKVILEDAGDGTNEQLAKGNNQVSLLQEILAVIEDIRKSANNYSEDDGSYVSYIFDKLDDLEYKISNAIKETTDGTINEDVEMDIDQITKDPDAVKQLKDKNLDVKLIDKNQNNNNNNVISATSSSI